MRVLLTFCDTGGGHRAAATALRDALHGLAPDAEVALADPYAASARWPFARLGAAYPEVVDHAAWLWHAGFRLTDSRAVTVLCQRLAWPVLAATFRALAQPPAPDVIVTTHPLLTWPLRRVFPDRPIVVVVTDLVTGHASWYEPSATLTVVPTAAARERALACGVPASRVVVHGLPVAPSFAADAAAAREVADSLGWSASRPTVLLVGGGDGVGPLEAIAVAIDDRALPCDLAVVAGRNDALASRLRERSWRGRVHVYGFVQTLPAMMAASACVITKAGPGTISEACAAGVPLILSGAIPGQETGNVHWVVEAGAGVWAPSPAAVASAVQEWTVGPAAAALRARAADAARVLGRPDAAREIALRVLALADAEAHARQQAAGTAPTVGSFG
jgi:1,2-diacylglycerol 3-beta-galactosyltransferase